MYLIFTNWKFLIINFIEANLITLTIPTEIPAINIKLKEGLFYNTYNNNLKTVNNPRSTLKCLHP
jgi:hypothetical protein